MREIVETMLKRERLNPTCIMCALNKYILRYPEDADKTDQVEYMQKVFSLFADAPKSTAIPVVVRDIENLRYELFGLKDDYSQIKWHFNEMLMEQLPRFRKMVEEAEEPLKLAMQLSLIGNYIDFAAVDHVDENYLNTMLEEARSKEFDAMTFDCFKKDLAHSKSMVFFTDNCGEVVLDRLLIEQIRKEYPHISVNVLVKGGEAVNDATMEDAIQIGLDQVAYVTGNGSNVSGTWFPEMTEESLDLVEQADIMFSKGQANFETLRHCGKNIYYLFLCKCDFFAGQFRVEPLTGIFMHEDDSKNQL